MKKVKLGLAAAVLLAGVSGSALATEVGKFYGAIDVGQATMNGFCDAAVGTSGVPCDESDIAFRGSIGYQVMPNLAVEAGYGDYGTAVATDGIDSIKGEVTSFQISAVGSYPIDKAFSITGKLGMAMSTAKITSTFVGVGGETDETDLVFGAGVLYNVNESIGIRGQFERINNGDAIDLLSAGVVFNF